MNSKQTSLRIAPDIFELAKRKSEVSARSIAGQVEYWSKIGCIIEKKMSLNELENIISEFNIFKNELKIK